MARSFREAEDASNAQGIPQATVDWALQNAANNPTPENLAIAKDTFNAQQAMINAAAGKAPAGTLVPTVTIGGAPAGYVPETQVSPSDRIVQEFNANYQKYIADAQNVVKDINTTLAEIDQQTADVNAAGKEAGDIAARMGGPKWEDIIPPKKPSAFTGDYADAFALLEAIFRSYGLESLVPKIKEYMQQNMGPNQATLLLKQTPEYKARFSGNESRVKAGKNAYDEATYLALENKFRETLSAYGQDRYATREEFADLIANDIAPTELNTRLDLAVNQVQNADPNILASLKQFYPSITQADLVGYFLKPDQALTDLQQKVTASEIGAAAQEQKLAPLDTARMLELQGLGVTQEAARTGFQKVATVLPESKKLSDIYGEAQIDYTQRTAEEEFLQGTASAARKRKQLQQLETAAFSGSSGTDTAQASSLGKSLQGKF